MKNSVKFRKTDRFTQKHFYDYIFLSNNESNLLLVPRSVCVFSGVKDKDKLKVMKVHPNSLTRSTAQYSEHKNLQCHSSVSSKIT